MIFASNNLPHEPLTRTFYELSRLQLFAAWWHWLLFLGACATVVAYVIFLYVRDGRELPRGLACALLLARLVALLGILLTFLNLEKRTERRLVKDSRVTLLVDVSQSMGLRDAKNSTSGPGSRIQQVMEGLSNGNLIADLQRQHDVVVYQFAHRDAPVQVGSFSRRRVAGQSPVVEPTNEALSKFSLSKARLLSLIAAVLFCGSLVLGSVYIFRGRTREVLSWLTPLSVLCLFASLSVLAVMNLRFPHVGPSVLLGLSTAAVPQQEPADEPLSVELEQPPLQVDDVDWQKILTPRGIETRLGAALRFVVEKERGGPIAGIVLLTDGNNNAGLEPSVAIDIARQAEIPVYTVGLGSRDRPANVRVANLEAPSRAYPGDAFTITGHLQSHGLDGRTVTVRLQSVSKGQTDEATTILDLEQQRIRLGDNQKLLPVRFEVTPQQQGRLVYQLVVSAPADDQDAEDNSKTASVHIVQRNNRVLLVASGPTREYRFLRNQLYRDSHTVVDVLLQSGKPGMSQEANEILYEFPSLPDELFSYDAIIAFDPDWTQLGAQQIGLLERWIAEKAGGLIVLAGPVHTPMWSGLRRGDPRIDTVKGFYPVVFYGAGTASLQLGQYGGQNPWPLEVTDEGRRAEFLWLDETAAASERTWTSFPGVYGYFAVKDAKPGARIYFRFSDPQAAVDDTLPIYMASHFYGAGRVFYLASGEMWRLRAIDEGHFEKFYTKLVRHVSAGRLLRDSQRGLLIVDKERCLLGETITVRASLTDLQHQPLGQPEISGSLTAPNGSRQPFHLSKVQDASREGMYIAQFTALLEGDYRLQLPLPGGDDEDVMVREVRVRVPDLEIENPQRNDSLLRQIAKDTGGEYYVGMDAALTAQGPPPLTSTLLPQDHVTYLAGAPDIYFERRLMSWLMAFIAGALCLEWLIRRLNRLA